MNQIFDQIQKKMEEIKEITQASEKLYAVITNPKSKPEDFDQAIKTGIQTLEKIDKGNNQQ